MNKICGSFLNFRPEFECYDRNISLSNNTCDDCDEFIFNTDIVSVSTTTEWNLVCEREWMRSTSESLLMTGVMIGSICLGSLSDHMGRRPVFLVSLIIQLIAGMAIVFSPNYITYVILRLIVGISLGGIFTTTYVMALEMVGPTKRRITGICYHLFWTTGYVLVGVLAYFFRNWRNLQLAMNLPLIFFLIYWWFMPESTRWLLTKGKIEKAKEILQAAAKENKKIISIDTLDQLLAKNQVETADESSMITLILKYPNLRKKTIIICVNWILISCTYFSLSFGAANLSGYHFLNHIISGLVEAPVYITLIFIVDIFGRKKILFGSIILTGISLVATGLFINYPDVHIVMYMLGKIGVTAAFGTFYLFTAEQYPTIVRNAGVGAAAMSIGIGGIIATRAGELVS
ncbi:organic cation transporter protein-like [Aphidius gifuensis]|uniref:organic cation transporter protein-like n=1 Tax=Aphidius gifuensis TaxID=684658 RepID=UPI001CDB99B1|nr:organic cation transporter protein-like [Aphidius gifuensis]